MNLRSGKTVERTLGQFLKDINVRGENTLALLNEQQIITIDDLEGLTMADLRGINIPLGDARKISIALDE